MANLPQFPETMPKEERQIKMAAAEEQLLARLTKEEPEDWRLPAGLSLADYPEAWANQILPVARKAHARLICENVSPKLDQEKFVAGGIVRERPMPDGLSYRKWSARVVLEELHRAGWRLAELLRLALAPEENPILSR